MRVCDETGRTLRTVGPGGLRKPADVAVDSVRNVYVADEDEGVLVFNHQGELFFKITGPEMKKPTAIALEAAGAVLVYDDGSEPDSSLPLRRADVAERTAGTLESTGPASRRGWTLAVIGLLVAAGIAGPAPAQEPAAPPEVPELVQLEIQAAEEALDPGHRRVPGPAAEPLHRRLRRRDRPPRGRRRPVRAASPGPGHPGRGLRVPRVGRTTGSACRRRPPRISASSCSSSRNTPSRRSRSRPRSSTSSIR